MVRRKLGHRGFNVHRAYTVDAVARALGIAKVTVRRWLKAGLPALTDQKPALILGSDLADFLASRKRPRQVCQSYESFVTRPSLRNLQMRISQYE